MHCKNCGDPILSEEKFCGKCGEKIIPHSEVKQRFQEHLDKDALLKKPISSEGDTSPKIKKGGKWGWYFLCFGIWASFKGSDNLVSFDEAHIFTMLFFLVGIIIAPILYYRTRDKLRIFNFIKNEGVRNFVIGFVFVLVFSFLINLFGALGDRIYLEKSGQVTQDAANLQKTISEDKIWFSDWQRRWDDTQSEIVDNTDSLAQYTKNVTAYKALQELNTENLIE